MARGSPHPQGGEDRTLTRKLLARDVLAYQAKVHAMQGEVLDAMAALDQEMGLYDDQPFADQGQASKQA